MYQGKCVVMIGDIGWCSVQDLKQQNELMLETKSLLEQKAASLTARADMVDDLQTELASLRAQTESLAQEKEMSGEKEEELMARVTHLELDNKHWSAPMTCNRYPFGGNLCWRNLRFVKLEILRALCSRTNVIERGRDGEMYCTRLNPYPMYVFSA